MVTYFRSFIDLSFELIFTGGRFKKKRIHLYVNPSKIPRVVSNSKSEGPEINPQSITHILAMQTSIPNQEMIQRTKVIAENINKPIITNKKTSLIFRDSGISVKQLRILGFEEEVIDGLLIDPVYMEELNSESIKSDENASSSINPLSIKSIASFGKKLGKTLNPLKFSKPVLQPKEKENIIDPTNPLAVVIYSSKNKKILLPLDKRGIKHIKQIINSIQPWLTVLPSKNISETFTIENTTKLLFLDDQYDAEELVIIPRSSNPNLTHQTLQGGYNNWFEIPS